MSLGVASFADRSREVVAEFLHTVVVIDDEARFQALESLVGEGTPPTGETASAQDAIPNTAPASDNTPDPPPASADSLKLVTPSLEQFQAAAEEGADSHDLDAKKIIDGFAKQGLVCAVLRPDAGESLALAGTRAVTRADIIVLDWVLHNDNGSATLGVISSILVADTDRLRLIVIYTGQNNLRAIADRLAELLGGLPHEGTMARLDDFTVSRGPIRMAVFAKSKTRIPTEDPAGSARVTTSEALPHRLVAEFAEMTAGLVSHVIVASLAALRRNAQRILVRLPHSLDAAYLWHRATQVHPLDAQEHLRSIVVEELAAVLVDEAVDARADIEAITAWLTANVPTDDYKARFGLNSELTRQDAIDLLTTGTGGKGKEAIREKFSTLGNKAHQKTHQCFAQSAPDNTLANEEFAMLLSLRSHYRPLTPILTLGTLLRSGAETFTYWICVQPACDSVRLSETTAFPLLPLTVAMAGEAFHVVVKSSDVVVRLRLKSKPLNLRMEQFNSNDTARGTVAASPDDQGCFFQAVAGARYDWLAELKPQHALRVVNKLTGQLGRVGVVESEWLRRWDADPED